MQSAKKAWDGGELVKVPNKFWDPQEGGSQERQLQSAQKSQK